MTNSTKFTTGVRSELSDVMPVVIPSYLYRKLEAKAKTYGVTARSLIALILSEGLDTIPDDPTEQYLKDMKTETCKVLLNGS